MEDRQKWVSLSFVLTAALAGYIVYNLSWLISGYIDLEARVRHLDLWVTGAAAMGGLGTFMVFYLNHTANQYMHEVVAELSRVTWPTTRETRGATVLVMIFVLLAGMTLGMLDWMWTNVMKGLLAKLPDLIGWMF